MTWLEDLSLGRALLMTAAATTVFCAAMAVWVPLRRFRIWFPVIMGGCAVGAVVVGRAEGHPAHQMLVLWSFTLIGLTVGMLPLRTFLTMAVRDGGRGGARGEYHLPRWRVAFCVVFCTLMAGVGAVLSTPK